MKARATDEQIIRMITEQEPCGRTAAVRWRYGINQGSPYMHKLKQDRMEPSDAKRLRALEVETAQLKKTLAKQMLD